MATKKVLFSNRVENVDESILNQPRVAKLGNLSRPKWALASKYENVTGANSTDAGAKGNFANITALTGSVTSPVEGDSATLSNTDGTTGSSNTGSSGSVTYLGGTWVVGQEYTTGDITVIDALTSTSTTNALSANQGRLLNLNDIASGAIVGTSLVLTKNDATTITIPNVSNLQGVLDQNNGLEITLSGTNVQVAFDFTELPLVGTVDNANDRIPLYDASGSVHGYITPSQINGSGVTNLAYTASPTQGVVTSDTGTDSTLPAVDNTNAGLMLPADKIKSDFITITQSVDLDDLEQDANDLITLTGVADGSTDMGTYTGSTITDNGDIKSNIQELETAIEALPQGVNDKTNGLDVTINTGNIEVDFDFTELAAIATIDTSNDRIPLYDADGLVHGYVTPAQIAAGSGGTNLTITNHDADSLDIESDTGTDVTLNVATLESGTNLAGLFTPIEKGQLTQQTITYAATINANLNNGNIVYVDMTGDATIAAPSNTMPGETVVYILTANGADRTATFQATSFKEEDGVTDTSSQVITSGTSKAFLYKVGPTVLHRIGGATQTATGVVQYTSGDAEIWASDTGVVFTKAANGEFTFAIPAGVKLYYANIAFTSGETHTASSNKVYILFDYADLRSYNTNAGNVLMPDIQVSPDDAAPSRVAPLNTADDITHGISSRSGGAGSDLEITVISAAQGLTNHMYITFPNH